MTNSPYTLSRTDHGYQITGPRGPVGKSYPGSQPEPKLVAVVELLNYVEAGIVPEWVADSAQVSRQGIGGKSSTTTG